MTTSVFVPSQEDFDSHLLKYPQRLLAPPPPTGTSGSGAGTGTGSGTGSGAGTGGVPRRVRPVPVQPPPGLEHLHHNTTTTTTATATATATATTSSYAQFVKMRAIAGCLDGDWSSNRPLPDIPSILLADLVRSAVVANGGQVSVNMLGTQHHQVPPSASSPSRDWSSDVYHPSLPLHPHHHQNHPHQNHLQHSDVKQQAIRAAAQLVTTPMSPFRNPSGSLNSIANQPNSGALMTGLDSRLTASVSNNHHHSDSHQKRRLAPTPIKTDSIFPKQQAPPLWRQAEEIHVPVQRTPTKSSTTTTSTTTATTTALQNKLDFQRTPRAPRQLTELTQKMHAVSLDTPHEQPHPPLTAVDTANFTYFHSPSMATAPDPIPSTAPTTAPTTATTTTTAMMEGTEQPRELTIIDSLPASVLKQCRPKIPPPPKASPEHRLAQRQKQIDIGKNTPEYLYYLHLHPKHRRKKHTGAAEHPVTPDKYQEISKRNWEGQVKAWRRRLHAFDPPQHWLDELRKRDDMLPSLSAHDEVECRAELEVVESGMHSNELVAQESDKNGMLDQQEREPAGEGVTSSASLSHSSSLSTLASLSVTDSGVSSPNSASKLATCAGTAPDSKLMQATSTDTVNKKDMADELVMSVMVDQKSERNVVEYGDLVVESK